ARAPISPKLNSADSERPLAGTKLARAASDLPTGIAVRDMRLPFASGARTPTEEPLFVSDAFTITAARPAVTRARARPPAAVCRQLAGSDLPQLRRAEVSRRNGIA